MRDIGEPVILTLPFPPSINALWTRPRSGAPYRSKEYRSWIGAAEAAYLMQKRAVKAIKGTFRYHVTLDARRWTHDAAGRKRPSDGDNREAKAVLDFLQKMGVIENDHLCSGGSWSWGAADGCTIILYAVEDQREAGAAA